MSDSINPKTVAEAIANVKRAASSVWGDLDGDSGGEGFPGDVETEFCRRCNIETVHIRFIADDPFCGASVCVPCLCAFVSAVHQR
jgi:hypothetical protein